MKRYIKNVLMLLIVMVGFTACSPDEETVMNITKAPQLATPENLSYVLVKESATFTVQTFSWTKGNFGYQAAAKYELQVSNTKDFAKIEVLGISTNVFLPVTVKALNQVVAKFLNKGDEPIDPEKDQTNLFVRVMCYVNDAQGSAAVTVASNIVSIMVTPYYEAPVYPTIYIVGTPNGWDINGAKCPLVCKTGDEVYTGVYNLEDSKNENMFRFYKKLGDWESNSVGSQVDDSPIDITGEFVGGAYSGVVVEGKGSFKVTKNGTYTIVVDLKKMAVSITEGGEDPSSWKYIYMVGNINGWSTESGKTAGKMTCKDGSEVYSAELVLPDSGDGFSFFRFLKVLDGTWGSQLGTTSGGDEPLVFEEGMVMVAIESGKEGAFKVPAGTY
ncbi:MAG: SusE domain-containing protein, partial [Muribaculaceae bacterium]